MKALKRALAIGVFLMAMQNSVLAQSILDRNISIQVERQRLDNVLEQISNKGNFYFSYNSNIIKRDSLVSLSVSNKTIQQVLELLFSDKYEFKQSGNYIIIRRKPIKASIVSTQEISADKFYTVSGYVIDNLSGNKISDASIYEKRLLVSTLTDDNGYFQLKLKTKNKEVVLTVSKELYGDTTISIRPKYNQELTITISPALITQTFVTISPKDFHAPDSLKLRLITDSAITDYLYLKKDSARLEKTAAAMFLLSYKQKIQSLNLSKYFTERPFQVSVTPGLSTHGRLNSQVINSFSLNIFGGYSGGLNGVEIGGLFNLDKKEIRGFQAAGIFNLTGGNVTGMQIAGINNTIINDLSGLQVAGINNYAKGKVKGLQISGIYNHASE
ncbi:MAG: STN and carboxypeptidase regulatory-like domain-containing protein, partial [Ginsengibacter sp.]